MTGLEYYKDNSLCVNLPHWGGSQKQIVHQQGDSFSLFLHTVMPRVYQDNCVRTNYQKQPLKSHLPLSAFPALCTRCCLLLPTKGQIRVSLTPAKEGRQKSVHLRWKANPYSSTYVKEEIRISSQRVFSKLVKSVMCHTSKIN